MKLKTLLLGSAGALAVAGGAAQAADLSVAEPVEYVKVCDAFGVGYWYIPGTDTCLKIGGYVQFDALFHTATDVYAGYSTHSAAWEFVTEASIQVTAKSMTEYGPLTGFIEIRAQSNNNNYFGGNPSNGDYRDQRKGAYMDSAWLELGPLLAGRTGSLYDYSGGLTIDGSDYDSDAAADQVRLSWAMSGFGVQLGIEDPRDRWGSSLSTSYSIPNIVAALTTTQGHWDGKLSVGYAQTQYGSGFGVQAAATIKLDAIAKGDALLLKAAWAQSQVGAFADAAGSAYSGGGSVWMALVSFKHFWSPTLSSAIMASFTDRPSTASTGDITQIRANLVWAPVTGFYAGIEGTYYSQSVAAPGSGLGSVWSAKIRLKRSW